MLQFIIHYKNRMCFLPFCRVGWCYMGLLERLPYEQFQVVNFWLNCTKVIEITDRKKPFYSIFTLVFLIVVRNDRFMIS